LLCDCAQAQCKNKGEKNEVKLEKYKEIIPFVQEVADTPLYAGEIYYLWEGLTLGYKLISALKTYMMNTENSASSLARTYYG